MDSAYKALSDPNRRDILRLLRAGDKTVNEIKEHLRITGPTLSHHLDILRRADLVTSEREGQFIRYRLNTTVFQEVLSALSSFFSPTP